MRATGGDPAAAEGDSPAAVAVGLATTLAAARVDALDEEQALEIAVKVERLKAWADSVQAESFGRMEHLAERAARRLELERQRRRAERAAERAAGGEARRAAGGEAGGAAGGEAGRAAGGEAGRAAGGEAGRAAGGEAGRVAGQEADLAGRAGDRRAGLDRSLAGRELVHAEIAPALRWSDARTDSALDLARHLRSLPRLTHLLQYGEADAGRVKAVADVMDEAALAGVFEPGDATWCEVEEWIGRRLPGLTAAEARRALRRRLMRIDPEGAARRRAAAALQRQVRVTPEADGMAVLEARLSAAAAMRVDTCLTAMADAARDHAARAGTPDERTHDQRRADAFDSVFTSILEGRPLRLVPGLVPGSESPASSLPAWWEPPPLPTRKGRRPHLVVTVASTTLAGTDDAPGELAGYGPIGAEIARQLASSAGQVQVVRFDGVPPRTGSPDMSVPLPRGAAALGKRAGRPAHPLPTPDCGDECREQGYTPSQRLVDETLAVHPRCDAPGCTRRAEHCDLDHVVPWSRGGTTCRHNLRPRCRRHHLLKTRAGWRSRPAPPGHPPGTVEWTTRIGRRYIVRPPDRPGSPDW